MYELYIHIQMAAKSFLCLILLSGLTTVVVDSYIIQPSRLQTCDYRVECDNLDNSHLTLSQFINNLSDYLTDNTTLIFLPGKYSLESELAVENVHSFSMFSWPGSSSKVEITCGHSARFEFRNVSTVTISGLEFIGCFQNHIITVCQFQFENSGFFGNGQPIVSGTGTVLSIEESTANLDTVVFNDMIFSIASVDRVTGIALRSSNITITHSWFERNNVGLIGAVISIELKSDLVIINSSFINNSAYVTRLSGIVHTIGHGSTVKIYDTRFMQNEGVILFGENLNVIIAHTRFMNNVVYSVFRDAIIRVTDSNLTVSHSTFNNNTGGILGASSTDVSISHSEFLCNYGGFGILDFDGVLATIDHSKFINNTGPGSMLWVTAIANRTEVNISYSEFLCNNGGNTLYYFDGVPPPILIIVSLSTTLIQD